jgi:hypothetical protein
MKLHFVLASAKFRFYFCCVHVNNAQYLSESFNLCFDLVRHPDLGWVKRLHQILGRRHKHNLHVCKYMTQVYLIFRMLEFFY